VRAFPRVVIACVVGAGLAAAQGALRAGERTHRVRPGESASTIAQQHYGKAELGSLLLLLNGRSGTVIRVGEALRVPYCDVHRVASGDTWSGLAKRYLGDPSRYPAVAALNGMVPERPLRVGDEIVVPVILKHRLEPGESLNRLAERFYGDDALAGVLGDFNRVEDPRRLSVGQEVEVPLVSLQLRDELRAQMAAATQPDDSLEPTAAAAAPPDRDSGKSRRFNDELLAATAAFDDGDYAAARERLEALVAPVAAEGSEADRIELGRLLAFVYVAFDMPAAACAAYVVGGPAVGPSPLDADLVSPKIRRVLADCDASPAPL